MQVPYTTLSEWPTHSDDLYQMIRRDEIVLSNVIPGPFMEAFQRSSGIERDMARCFWERWVHSGNILVHAGVEERRGLLILQLCLHHHKISAGTDWGELMRHVLPYSRAWHTQHNKVGVHLRVPVTPKRGMTLFVPTMLKDLRESGLLTGVYSTWGTSHRVPDLEIPALHAAWGRAVALARRVHQQFMADKSRLLPESRDRIDLVDVVAHVYNEPASDLVVRSTLGRLARDLIRACGRENAIRLVTRAQGRRVPALDPSVDQ